MSGSLGRVTFLGTGTSHGVPMIGCRCATCTSTDSRDQRLRPSIYVELANGGAFVVDTPPDFRTQALRFGVLRVDAVVFTHPHADHLLGLDEIRRFNALQRAVVPCYGNPETILEVRRVFAYAFEPRQPGGGVPQLELHAVTGSFEVAGTTVTPVPVMHGALPIHGYRVGTFAYLTDCSAIPDASWALLEGVRDAGGGRAPAQAAPDALHRGAGARGGGAGPPRTRAADAHRARPRPRGDLRAISRTASSWHMMV